jgi:hypothetical protein
MIDPTDLELAAMDDAGNLGGEYLDEIKKTDLSTLTHDEWQTFIRTVCGGYVDSVVEKNAAANNAMNKITPYVPT